MERPKLEKLYGSTFCEYSVIQNDLAVLYQNQEKILDVLMDIEEKLEALTGRRTGDL